MMYTAEICSPCESAKRARSKGGFFRKPFAAAAAFRRPGSVLVGLLAIGFLVTPLLSPVSAHATEQAVESAIPLSSNNLSSVWVASSGGNKAGLEAYQPVRVALGANSGTRPSAPRHPTAVVQNNREFSSMETNRFIPSGTTLKGGLTAPDVDPEGTTDTTARMPLVALAWLFGVAIIGMGMVGRRKQPKP